MVTKFLSTYSFSCSRSTLEERLEYVSLQGALDFLEEFKICRWEHSAVGCKGNVGSYGSYLCAEPSRVTSPAAAIFSQSVSPPHHAALQPKVGAGPESPGALVSEHRFMLADPICNCKTGLSCPQAKCKKQFFF